MIKNTIKMNVLIQINFKSSNIYMEDISKTIQKNQNE